MVAHQGSSRLDVRKLDDLAPLVGLFSNKLAKLGRRQRHRLEGQARQARLQIWISHDSVGRLVQRLNDLGRSFPRRNDAVPTDRLIARHKLAQCGNVR